jgi:hypothetical protein
MERADLASVPAHAGTLKAMQAKLAEANKFLFKPDRGSDDPRACAAVKKNGGYWGPFAP